MAETRRANQFLQEKYRLAYSHVANSNAGTVTVKLDKLTSRMRVTRVKYINVTGLAEDATNAAILSVQNGSTVVASWNTDSDSSASDVSIPANTFIDLTLSTTTTELVFAAGDVLSFVIAESGTTTVPAGLVIVEGVYF